MLLTLATGRLGGTEVYAENLVEKLRQTHDSRFDFTIVRSSQSGNRDSGAHRDAQSDEPHFRTITVEDVTAGTSHLTKLRAWLGSFVRRRRIWADIELAAGGQVDVALFPLTAVQPKPLRRMKTVTVIHDLQHLDNPDAFTIAQRIYRKLAYERPARRADAVVTVSDFSRESVITRLRIEPTRVTRIYPGIDASLFTPGGPADELSEPARSLASKGTLLYFPARALAHKNHRRLFEAVSLVRATHTEIRLILSGSDAAQLGKLPDFVEHVGNVTAVQVRDLYRVARLVVFPSLYEGFGFPPLEALSTGASVVASTAGALPETLAARAILVDATDPESIRDGIEQALRNEAAEVVFDASPFDWKSTRDQIADLLASL